MEEQRDRLRLVASRDAEQDSLRIYQDARIYLSQIRSGGQVSHLLPVRRHAWLQVLRGAVLLNGHALGEGDGVALSDEESLTMEATKDSEIMLFDLA